MNIKTLEDTLPTQEYVERMPYALYWTVGRHEQAPCADVLLRFDADEGEKKGVI